MSGLQKDTFRKSGVLQRISLGKLLTKNLNICFFSVHISITGLLVMADASTLENMLRYATIAFRFSMPVIGKI